MKLFSILKKIVTVGILSLFIFSIFGTFAHALDCTKEYCPLTTVPGAFTACKTDANGVITCEKGTVTNPVSVIKNIYNISIGIGAILAVVMIIWAGIEYATTEAITGKSDAKEKWQGALFGLVLLLASYIILRTINVDLVNINLDLGTPQKGEVVDVDALKNALENINEQAQKQILQSEQAAIQKEKTISDAQKKLIDAQKDGNLEKIAIAQKELVDAQNNKIETLVKLAQAKTDLGVVQAIKDGNFDIAQKNIVDSATTNQEQIKNLILGDVEKQTLIDSLKTNVLGAAQNQTVLVNNQLAGSWDRNSDKLFSGWIQTKNIQNQSLQTLSSRLSDEDIDINLSKEIEQNKKFISTSMAMLGTLKNLANTSIVGSREETIDQKVQQNQQKIISIQSSVSKQASILEDNNQIDLARQLREETSVAIKIVTEKHIRESTSSGGINCNPLNPSSLANTYICKK